MNDELAKQIRHSVILGDSGMGKSFFVKLEALKYFRLGSNVIILEQEEEYREHCNFANQGLGYVFLDDISPVIIPEYSFIVLSFKNVSDGKKTLIFDMVMELISQKVGSFSHTYIVLDFMLSMSVQEKTSKILLSLTKKDQTQCTLTLIEQRLHDIMVLSQGLDILKSVSAILLFRVKITDENINIFKNSQIFSIEQLNFIDGSQGVGDAWVFQEGKADLMKIDASFTKKELVGFY